LVLPTDHFFLGGGDRRRGEKLRGRSEKRIKTKTCCPPSSHHQKKKRRRKKERYIRLFFLIFIPPWNSYIIDWDPLAFSSSSV
jgi:hypothetical protein